MEISKQLMRIRQSDWLLTLILAVSSFIFGLIGGELLEIIVAPLFALEIRAVLMGLFTVGLLTVSILISITFFARRAEKREQEWLRIKECLGTPAEIIFEPLEKGQGSFYRKLAGFIQQTSEGDEILVMTYYS